MFMVVYQIYFSNSSQGAIQKPRRQPGGRGVKKFLILSTSTYIKSVYVREGGVEKFVKLKFEEKLTYMT